MRQSFQMAITSWIATFAFLLFNYGSIGYLGITVSLALSLLWMTHLVVFAARNSAAANAGSNPMPMPIDFFLNNLAFAAAETAVLYRPGLKDLICRHEHMMPGMRR
jgi:hypothetical protein